MRYMTPHSIQNGQRERRLSIDMTVRLPMASRKSSCRTPDWNLKCRERISVRAAFASSAHSCTLSHTKCVSVLFL
jgi:hypothetical protein